MSSSRGLSALIPEAESCAGPGPYDQPVTWRTLLPSGRALALDAALATGSLAITVDRLLLGVGVPTDVAGSAVWTLPLFLVASVGLLVRRTRPLLCVLAVVAPYAVHAAVTGHAVEGAFALLPGLVAVYSLGAYSSGRRLLLGIAAVVVFSAVHDANDPTAFPTETSTWAYLFFVAVAAGTLLAGMLVGGLRRSAASRAEVARAEAARRDAVASERAKIARELHDVVTHNVNAVVLQAMAAQGVLDSDPRQAQRPLAAIETSARAALVEMRRMLGVLREGDQELLTPQPGVADVRRLVESLRSHGLNVSCAITGEGQGWPEGLELAVYRIVQESLTNAMKHAHGSRCAVTIDGCADGVVVQVTNEPGTPLPDAAGAGHGLIGMTERASLLGGTVGSGHTPDGGYCVRAVLPTGPRSP